MDPPGRYERGKQEGAKRRPEADGIRAIPDGDGLDDASNLGFNHSGSPGYVRNGVIVDDGAVDFMISLWYGQDPLLKKQCQVTAKLLSIDYSTGNVGIEWKFTASAAGARIPIPSDGSTTPLFGEGSLSTDKIITSLIRADVGEEVTTNFHINANNLDARGTHRQPRGRTRRRGRGLGSRRAIPYLLHPARARR